MSGSKNDYQVSIRSDIEICGQSVDEVENRALFLQQLRSRRDDSANTPTMRADRHDLTSIVIVAHNEVSCTEMCLASIRLFTPEAHELLVVDNASTDGTVAFLRNQAHVQLFENPINRGFAAGCNLGIHHARGKQILLLNNDVVVTAGWLARMLNALYSADDLGLVGPVSNNVSGQQQTRATYDDLNSLETFANEWSQANAGQCQEVSRLIGFCLLFRREVVEQVGLLDERFGIGMFEDDDFVRRAQQSGFRAAIVRDAFVHHFGSVSFKTFGFERAQRLFYDNLALYREKWKNAAAGDPELAKLPGLVSASDKNFSIEVPPDSGDVRLSLCMIVRDNERTIRACLESIRPWVDQMIVVDTGSTDATSEIARELGAQVHRFPWCDDFSAARNESLRHARGEWVFWMDSDDTIDAESGRTLRSLVDQADESITGYVMKVHCPGPGPEHDRELTVVDHVKVFRNAPDLRFEGRIHEQILPAIKRRQGVVQWTDAFVVHSGYDHSPEGQERKKERDLRLLHLELSEQPDHPFTLFNLGMTYAHLAEPQKAIDYLRQSIARSAPEDSHVRKAYALLVHALKDAGEAEEALATCNGALELFPGDIELLFRRGLLLHAEGRLVEARDSYLLLLTSSPVRRFNSIDPGMGGFKARQNLAAVYLDLGDFLSAETQWRRIVAEAPDYRPGWRGLANVLMRCGRVADAESLADSLIQRGPYPDEGFMLKARIAQERGEIVAAHQFLLSARRQGTDELEALRQLCALLFENGTLEDAQEALEELSCLEPEDPAVHHNLGTVYLRRGRAVEAVAAYRKSLELRPHFFQTWLFLGVCYRELNRQHEAAESLRQAAGAAANESEREEATRLLRALG